MSKLCYPTIDLFIYDLKSPLNAQKENIEHNRSIFKGRFKDKLDTTTKFKEIEEDNSNSGYIPLLKRNFLKLETYELEGYFYPVLLNDTYGLLVNCSIKNKLKPQSIEPSFDEIKKEVSQYNKLYENITIGQTKIISGWLSEEASNIEAMAEESYKSVVDKPKQWSNVLYGQGKFLNSDIWEIWDPLSKYLDEHLLIIIFSDQESFEKSVNTQDKYWEDWMRLFVYRHKIMWSYSQSHTVTKTLKIYYKKIDAITTNLEMIYRKANNLEKLQNRFQEIQIILDKFTRDLLKLNLLKETIETNLYNYVQLTETINKKAGKDSDLSFLEQFSYLTETKYLKQIDKDEANMQLGLQLLESNINALRSQIELEKSERDRNFQNLVAILGGGTAIVSVLDFKGEKCQTIANSWPFEQEAKNNEILFPCNEFLFSGVLTPFLVIVLASIFVLGLKWILKKVRF